MEVAPPPLPRPRWWALLLPLAAALATFLPVLWGGFLSDDFLLGHFLRADKLILLNSGRVFEGLL